MDIKRSKVEATNADHVKERSFRLGPGLLVDLDAPENEGMREVFRADLFEDPNIETTMPGLPADSEE